MRWADVGGAVLSEDEAEQRRHQNLARQIVDTPGRAIPLRRLLSRTDFPRDPMVLYAEGYSLTRFLVDKKDRKTWLAFVRQGMDDGWDKAVKQQYDFSDVEALEDAWLADLRRPEKARAIPPAPASGKNELDIPVSLPPVMGFAMMSKDGLFLRLRQVGSADAPAALPLKNDSGPPAVSVPVLQMVTRMLVAVDTPVYAMDGTRIDVKNLPELLMKERPVLVSQDGKMVDAFHLQLIKEGTLIIAPRTPR